MLEQEEEIVVDFAEETEKAQVAILVQAQNGVSAIQEKLTRKGLSHCEECGDEIPLGRQQAYPAARTCVSCQEYIEKFYMK